MAKRTKFRPLFTDSYWRLHALRLPEGAAAVGKTVGEMDLPSNHVEITMVSARKGKNDGNGRPHPA